MTPELSPDKFIDFVDILEEEYKTVPIDTMVFWGTCSFLMIIHRSILVLSTDWKVVGSFFQEIVPTIEISQFW